MVKSQRKESTDPRLNPDKTPGKRGGKFTEECGECCEEADYSLEHRPRREGAEPKFSRAARHQEKKKKDLLTRKEPRLKTQKKIRK